MLQYSVVCCLAKGKLTLTEHEHEHNTTHHNTTQHNKLFIRHSPNGKTGKTPPYRPARLVCDKQNQAGHLKTINQANLCESEQAIECCMPTRLIHNKTSEKPSRNCCFQSCVCNPTCTNLRFDHTISKRSTSMS